MTWVSDSSFKRHPCEVYMLLQCGEILVIFAVKFNVKEVVTMLTKHGNNTFDAGNMHNVSSPDAWQRVTASGLSHVVKIQHYTAWPT